MTRPLLIVGTLLAGLILWDQSLGESAGAERRQRSRIGRLIPQTEREAMTVAVVRLEGRGAPILYGRDDANWRVLTTFNAPADGQALDSLVRQVLEAEGMVVDVDTDNLQSLGFGTGGSLRLALCGVQALADPAGDVLFALDLGRSLPAAGGLGAGRSAGYVRAVGRGETWRLDTDLRAALGNLIAPHLPPLLDPSLIPRSWPGHRGGATRIEIQRPGEVLYALLRRERELTPAQRRDGENPWEWFLEQGGVETPAAPTPAFGYATFLSRTPFADLLDPSQTARFIPDPPQAVVRLIPREGTSAELRLGTRLNTGSPTPGAGDGSGSAPLVALESTASGMLFAITAPFAELLLPSRDLFAPGTSANPWAPTEVPGAGAGSTPPR